MGARAAGPMVSVTIGLLDYGVGGWQLARTRS
jgi:hypothetical protein